MPTADYEIELGKAATLRQGTDVTVVAWGAQVHVARKAVEEAEAELGISCELIDLRSLLPWDVDTSTLRQCTGSPKKKKEKSLILCNVLYNAFVVAASVEKTGRLVITHEAAKSCGLGAEIAQSISERCFLSLESPIEVYMKIKKINFFIKS